jgi:iron complex transport system permease protein
MDGGNGLFFHRTGRAMKFILTALLAAAFLVSLGIGRFPISVVDLARIALTYLGLGHHVSTPSPEMQLVFWNIRLPRILMSIAVGSGVSIAGVVFQALFRNPLAAPDILGVTAGSCFGAALSIMFFTQAAFAVQGSAFIFGILAVAIAYVLATRSGDRSASVLVIAGIVVSAVFHAGVSIMMYLADPYDQLARIVFWIMGSFRTTSWTNVETTLPIVIVGSILLTVFGWRLNVMTQNEEDVLSLGVNILRWRFFYVLVSTLMVASSVAAVGTISWVGLIVPHIARYLVGAEHKRLLPCAALLGGSFLLIMDTVARTISASEIPISIVTSVLGAPFLGYLVMYRKGGDRFDERCN